MNLQDVFDQLTYGELSNLSIGGADSGGIAEADYPKVISHINMAVKALYIKFGLSESVTSITLESGTYTYTLDTALTITGVYDETGRQLGFNDPTDPSSVFTPRWDTIQVPSSVIATTLYISHMDKPPTTALDADPDDTDIDLPDVLLEPLLAYVVGRLLISKSSTESIQEGQAQMNRYKLLCLELRNANVLNISEQATNLKLEMRGWQ